MLASGGFAADLMKVTSRQPRWAVYVERAGAAKTSTGDGLTMGLQVGAKEVSDSWLMGTQFAPAYPEMTAAMLGERGFAGATLVNEKGLRFVKEDLPNITSEMSQQLDVWLITDSKDPEKAKTLRNYLGFDTVVHGNTPEELGRRMGARADNVKQTIENSMPMLPRERILPLAAIPSISPVSHKPLTLPSRSVLSFPERSADSLSRLTSKCLTMHSSPFKGFGPQANWPIGPSTTAFTNPEQVS